MVTLKRYAIFLLLFACIQFFACISPTIRSDGHPRDDESVGHAEDEITDSEGTGEQTTMAPVVELTPDASVQSRQHERARPVEDTVTAPAVIALLEDAEQYATAGRLEQAAASLERAVRIEPKNPIPWYYLGLTRLKQNRWDQAIALAQKSNALSSRSHHIQSRNWQIIAQARSAMGDKAGARQAREIARRLSN